MKKYKKMRTINSGLLDYMKQATVPEDEMLKAQKECMDSDSLEWPESVEALYDGPEIDWEDEESVLSEEEGIEPSTRIEDYYDGPEPDWEDEEFAVPEEEGIEPPTRIEDFYEGLESNCVEDGKSEDIIRISVGGRTVEIPSDSSTREVKKIEKHLEQMEQLEQKKNLDKLKRYEGIGPYDIAKRLLDKHRFIYLDPPYKNKTLSYFNGKYWMILDDDILDGIIYRELSEEEKRAAKKINSLVSSVKEFITLECFDGYMCKKRKYFFSQEDFEAVEYCTVFSNGIYNILEGEFHTDLDASQLPYSFALDAEYYEEHDKRQKTYYMDKLLMDASGDEETVQMAYEMLGYLTVPCNNAKCFITLAGVGDSGKSVFGSFCEKIFAEERSFRIQPELLGSRFAYSSADIANLYTCLDMEMRFLTVKEVSQIKQISGEENLRSEAKYKKEKTIPIRFKLLLATNGTVQCQPMHEDKAFYRRLQIIPFLCQTREENMIAGLPKLLQAEKSAILSKAVRAISECVNENGMIFFHVSELSAHVKASWSNSIDYDKEFLEDAFEITGNPEDSVCKQDVSALYASYCEMNSDKMKVRSQTHALFSKIGKLDSRIIFGSNVKSRKNLGTDFTNPVACFKGIKWNKNFLRTYYSDFEEDFKLDIVSRYK